MSHSSLDKHWSHSYCGTVKNITISVEDALYREARVAAAKRQTSVSAMVRGYLTALVQGKIALPDEDESEEARDLREREELADLLGSCRLVLGYEPSREKTYER